MAFEHLAFDLAFSSREKLTMLNHDHGSLCTLWCFTWRSKRGAYEVRYGHWGRSWLLSGISGTTPSKRESHLSRKRDLQMNRRQGWDWRRTFFATSCHSRILSYFRTHNNSFILVFPFLSPNGSCKESWTPWKSGLSLTNVSDANPSSEWNDEGLASETSVNFTPHFHSV